jgi:putative chitinase
MQTSTPVTDLIDRKKLFDGIRHDVFHGHFSQGQVQGIDAIIDAWDYSVFSDLRWLAYMLGTTYHETGAEMQPIPERGSIAYFTSMYDIQGRRPDTARRMGNIHPGDGAKFRGRGYVQITWHDNYLHGGQIVGEDLVNNPDLALRKDIAAKLMFAGMTDEKIIFEDFSDTKNFTFTGKSLEDYFNDTTEDWINARRIINGTDHAVMIAETSKKFYEHLDYRDT